MTSTGEAAALPERNKHPKASAGIRSALGFFNNLSIQIKASAASALLLICLLGLGANAYLTSTRSAEGLQVLTNQLIPKQQAFSQVSEAVVATHMKIFRYVSWASNGVSDILLKPLYAEINSDLEFGIQPHRRSCQTARSVQPGTRGHAGAAGQVAEL